MLILWFLLAPLYFGVVWLLSRWVCRDAAHQTRHRVSAAAALVLAVVVVSLGVPYADNPQDRIGVPMALGLLSLGPILIPRLGPKARLALGLAVIAAFVEPVIRVEYLTRRSAPALKEALARESTDPENDRLFSILSWSPARARVLRVERDKTAYLLDFVPEREGTWRVDRNYPPQQLLWYYGNSGWYDCPYPTSVLLLLHGAGAWCG